MPVTPRASLSGTSERFVIRQRERTRGRPGWLVQPERKVMHNRSSRRVMRRAFLPDKLGRGAVLMQVTQLHFTRSEKSLSKVLRMFPLPPHSIFQFDNLSSGGEDRGEGDFTFILQLRLTINRSSPLIRPPATFSPDLGREGTCERLPLKASFLNVSSTTSQHPLLPGKPARGGRKIARRKPRQ